MICWIPPPDPIGPYVTFRPKVLSTFGIQAETRGATNELPAPMSEPLLRCAPAVAVRTKATLSAPRTASVRRVKVSPLMWFMSRRACPRSCPTWEERWCRAGDKVVNGAFGREMGEYARARERGSRHEPAAGASRGRRTFRRPRARRPHWGCGARVRGTRRDDRVEGPATLGRLVRSLRLRLRHGARVGSGQARLRRAAVHLRHPCELVRRARDRDPACDRDRSLSE